MSTASRQRNPKSPARVRGALPGDPVRQPGQDKHLVPRSLKGYTAESATKVRGAFGKSNVGTTQVVIPATEVTPELFIERAVRKPTTKKSPHGRGYTPPYRPRKTTREASAA